MSWETIHPHNTKPLSPLDRESRRQSGIPGRQDRLRLFDAILRSTIPASRPGEALLSPARRLTERRMFTAVPTRPLRNRVPEVRLSQSASTCRKWGSHLPQTSTHCRSHLAGTPWRRPSRSLARAVDGRCRSCHAIAMSDWYSCANSFSQNPHFFDCRVPVVVPSGGKLCCSVSCSYLNDNLGEIT